MPLSSRKPLMSSLFLASPIVIPWPLGSGSNKVADGGGSPLPTAFSPLPPHLPCTLHCLLVKLGILFLSTSCFVRCPAPTSRAPMQVVAIAASSSTTNDGARARAVGTVSVLRKDAECPRARHYLSPRPGTPNKGTWNVESSTCHTTRKQGKDDKPD